MRVSSICEPKMRTLTIQPNKDGTKRIKIGNFIIRFECCEGHQFLGILKDARGLPKLEASARNDETDEKETIKDWMIHINETDDPDDE